MSLYENDDVDEILRVLVVSVVDVVGIRLNELFLIDEILQRFDQQHIDDDEDELEYICECVHEQDEVLDEFEVIDVCDMILVVNLLMYVDYDNEIVDDKIDVNIQILLHSLVRDDELHKREGR